MDPRPLVRPWWGGAKDEVGLVEHFMMELLPDKARGRQGLKHTATPSCPQKEVGDREALG